MCCLFLFVVSKVAIAPPPSLMDLDIPPPEGFLQREKEKEEAAAAAAAAASGFSLAWLCDVNANVL